MKITLENGHEYLQKYCVAEVICLIFFGTMLWQQVDFIFDNIFRLNEWQCAALAPFAMATWGGFSSTFKSINANYG